ICSGGSSAPCVRAGCACSSRSSAPPIPGMEARWGRSAISTSPPSATPGRGPLQTWRAGKLPQVYGRWGRSSSSAPPASVFRSGKNADRDHSGAMATAGPREDKLILVVDDIDDGRMLLTEMLTHAGFRVAEAADGNEALERAYALTPDLIIM